MPDIMAGYADFALLGSDKYGEVASPDGLRFDPVGKLACRFALAVPETADPAPDQPLTIATSYPRALSAFIGATGVNACVGPVRPGKVEGTVAQGIADGVFDICETGESLAANGLRAIAESDNLELGGVWLDRP